MRQLNRPLFLSFDPDIKGLDLLPTSEFLEHFRHNIGNLAFVYAMSRQIRGQKTYFGSVNLPVEEYKNHFDSIVFPAANNIGEEFDMGWLASLIEDTDLPLLIIGLGIQAPLGQSDVRLPAGTKRFIAIAKERNLPIGVRGNRTKRFLNDLGIETAKVTGCPSNFLNRHESLGQVIEAKFARLVSGISSVALNLEYFRLDSTRVKTITSWLEGRDGSLILQSDEKLFSYVRGDFDGGESDISWFGQYFTGQTELLKIKSWLSSSTRIFNDMPSWIHYLEGQDISVGSRFHGNLLAMQAGVPAIVFPHDARTVEMCETMLIPYFLWHDIQEHSTLESVLSKVTFDGVRFDSNRRELAKAYEGLVTDMGLTFNKTLLSPEPEFI
jgi:hypothetical protein